MRRQHGKGFSRFSPRGDDPITVRVALITMALNELRAISPQDAEDVARAFLGGHLTPKPKTEAERIIPWKRSRQ